MKHPKTFFAKALLLSLFIVLALLPRAGNSNSKPGFVFHADGGPAAYTTFTPNNIHTWVTNTGIFDQNPTINNTPGFEWPAGSGKHAIFTAGLTIMAYVNGQLRMSAASYTGEYLPGKVIYNAGNPEGYTDSTFKIYKVSFGDNCSNNPDWANWGLMVPYGAPYTDVNSNNQYDPCTDIPGVPDAKQTIFVYLTDAFPSSHTSSEGFGGGTDPLFAEMAFTMWGYQGFAVNDMQFMKWNIINKNTTSWDSVFVGTVSDPDIGDATDDYIGTDTLLNLAYAYNFDNMDGNGGAGTYGANPPAAGFQFLKSPIVGGNELNLTSLNYFTNTGSGGTPCEQDPETPIKAYNYLKGYKSDGTPWLNAEFNPPVITKFCYPGDPETGMGWTEYTGKVNNCGGSTTGSIVTSPAGDRRLIMSTGSNMLSMAQNDTMEIVMSQLIARGSDNKNSVTKLKELAALGQGLYLGGFANVGISQISTTIPDGYSLSQNYPNPFNPSTKIGFEIPISGLVKIKVYDISGREVDDLVNTNLTAGVYAVDFDGSNFASGLYFYTLEIAGHRETKKMILLK